MNTRSNILVTATFAVIFGFLSIFNASAQEVVEKKEVVASMVEQLKNDAEKFKGVMSGLQEDIDGITDNIVNAEKRFDEMVALVEEAAATYGPDSPYVAKVNRLIEEAEKSAGSARRKNMMPLVTKFEADVKAFTVFREQAIAIYRDSEASIADIKEKKEEMVLYYKSKLFDEAKVALGKGQEYMSSFNKQLKEAGKSVEDHPQ